MTLLSPPSPAPDATSCPECSAVLDVDDRYVTWCPACDWNVDPDGVRDDTGTRAGRRAVRRREAARARAERLYADVSAAGDLPPRRDGDWLLASLVAGAVHLVTAGLVVAAVWMLIVGPLVLRLLGVLALGIAVLLRPRLGRTGDDEWAVPREQAPALWGLVDRVAQEAGAPAVHEIRVTHEFNASYGKLGLRQRGSLTIGLALWETLDPQARIALLGHELGHAVNGDNRRLLWQHAAVTSLAHWHELLRPTLVTGDDLLSLVSGWLTRALLYGPRMAVRCLLLLLDRLTRRAGQRAEYLADGIAARIGSAQAAVAMLERFTSGDTVTMYLMRRSAALRTRPGRRGSAVMPGEAEEFWSGLRADVAAMPAAEHLRVLRVSALHLDSVDSTHPPTHLRVRLAEARAAHPAALTLDDTEAEAIDRELADPRARALRALLAARS